MDIKTEIKPPYFFESGSLPGLDFNREIIEPGTQEAFPEGAVGIRADDDFWVVAALPYRLKEIPLSDIVAQLWPEYAEKAIICPDSGTPEQHLYFAETALAHERKSNNHLNQELRKAHDQLHRIRAERPKAHEHHPTRKRAESDYFFRQYEHLLIATAHKEQPREDAKGICKICGLLGSHLVHRRHYRDLHDAGYEPHVQHLLDFENDED